MLDHVAIWKICISTFMRNLYLYFHYDHQTWQGADFGEKVQHVNALVLTNFLYMILQN